MESLITLNNNTISGRTGPHRGFNMQQLAAGTYPRRWRKKAIEKIQHIKERKERFSSNAIPLSDYIPGMSQHISL